MERQTNETSSDEYKNPDLRWAVTWELAQALWPRWKANDVQTKLWRRMLFHRNQLDVRKILEEVACEKAAITPRIAWVLEKVKGRAPVDSMAKERYSLSEEEITKARHEQPQMIDELLALPPERLERAMELGIKASGIDGASLPDDLEDWPEKVRGMVWAAAFGAAHLENLR